MEKPQLDHILNCHPITKTDIVRGKNTNLYSKSGKRIIDFESGIWSTALGHSNPRINAAMIEQIQKVIHLHYKLTPEIAETLAANLLELFSFQDGKAIFLSSGSEAVELSMRLSRKITDGGKALTFSTSYLSAYSNTQFPRDVDFWVEVDFLQCNKCEKKDCTNECDLLKKIELNDISSFVFEPGSSCGRVLFPPKKLVRFLANEVKRNGGYIIINEVTTGFGRTGEWFGFNHYDIKPDIVAVGKSLGNGYPISGVIMRKEIASRVEKKNFAYAQSHQNDPLGCKVANEVINIFKEDNMIHRSKSIGEFFLNQLKDIRDSCTIIKEVRGRGLMIAVELNIANITEIIAGKMLDEGYFIGTTPGWNILRFYPAITIDKNDIRSMCKTLRHVLKQVETECTNS